MRKSAKLTRAQQEAMAAYAQLVRRWDALPKFARGPVRAQAPTGYRVPGPPPGRETVRPPSLDAGGTGGTKPIEGKRYTGSAMLGVGVLHKSNLVPIFDPEAAVDIARMRRS